MPKTKQTNELALEIEKAIKCPCEVCKYAIENIATELLKKYTIKKKV